MHITRYSLGHELLCACRDIWAPPKKVMTFYCSIKAVSVGSATKGKNRVCLLLWLLLQLGEKTYGCCVSQERGCVVLGKAMAAASAAVPAGENKCVCSSYGSASSDLLAWALPTLGSVNSVDRVNRETVGTVSRIGSPGTNSTVQFMFHSFLWDWVEKETAIHSSILA